MAEVLVEGSQRLIEKEQRRVVHDGAGKGHALLLSARELPGEAVLKPGERLGDTGSNGSMIYDVMISLPYITAEHGRSVNVSAKMAEDTEASI